MIILENPQHINVPDSSDKQNNEEVLVAVNMNDNHLTRKRVGNVNKPKRLRTKFTGHQIATLTDFYHNRSNFISRMERFKLANELELPERQIKLWFQNFRQKIKQEAKSKDSRVSIQKQITASKMAQRQRTLRPPESLSSNSPQQSDVSSPSPSPTPLQWQSNQQQSYNQQTDFQNSHSPLQYQNYPQYQSLSDQKPHETISANYQPFCQHEDEDSLDRQNTLHEFLKFETNRHMDEVNVTKNMIETLIQNGIENKSNISDDYVYLNATNQFQQFNQCQMVQSRPELDPVETPYVSQTNLANYHDLMQYQQYAPYPSYPYYQQYQSSPPQYVFQATPSNYQPYIQCADSLNGPSLLSSEPECTKEDVVTNHNIIETLTQNVLDEQPISSSNSNSFK